MQIDKYLQTLLRMDRLIALQQTGTPQAFARKLQLSERQTRVYIKCLKNKGAPISYCRRRRSYVYEDSGHFHIEFSFQKDDTLL